MLIQFTIENFASFKSKNTLSMEKGQRLRKYNDTNTMIINDVGLLKNAIIFGPNGSGKSNLIFALSSLRKLVLNPTKSINSKLSAVPFLPDDNSNKNPTNFEIEFIVNEIQYFYTLSYNKTKIIKEELSVLNKNKYDTYFERNEDDLTISPKNNEMLILKTRPNSLFLFNLQNENDFHAKNVLDWFKNYLIFADSSSIDDYLYLLEDEHNKKLFIDILNFADFNLIDIEIKVSKNKISSDTIRLFHNFMQSITDEEQSLPPVEDIEPTESITNKVYTVYRKYDFNGEVIGTKALDLNLESLWY